MTQCPFENCNQSAGHDGPHGFAMAPGLICAPHGGGEGQVGAPEPVDLQCDCCGSPMTLQRYEHGGGRFVCTQQNRECHQDWSFGPDGRGNRTVIARMYPYKMKEGSKLYDEFLDYRLAECTFDARARALCGLITSEDADKKIAGFAATVAQKRAEIAASKPWWKFW